MPDESELRRYLAEQRRERKEKPVEFYVEFESADEKLRIKPIIETEIKAARKEMPAGPDYPVTNIFYHLWFKELGDDSQRAEGLKFAFKKTPEHFDSPEALEKFLLNLLHQKGAKVKQRERGDEVYEVLGDKPVPVTKQ